MEKIVVHVTWTEGWNSFLPNLLKLPFPPGVPNFLLISDAPLVVHDAPKPSSQAEGILVVPPVPHVPALGWWGQGQTPLLVRAPCVHPAPFTSALGAPHTLLKHLLPSQPLTRASWEHQASHTPLVLNKLQGSA